MYKEVTITTETKEYTIYGDTTDDSFVIFDNYGEDFPCIFSGSFIACMLKLTLMLEKEK